MKGQLELSFGMIFSLLIIIATVGTAGYFITKFVETGKCTTLQLAYAELQEGVDSVWGAAVGNKEISLQVPSGITSLCIGDMSSGTNATLRELIDVYIVEGIGVYALPPTNACDGELAARKLTHLASTPLLCKPVVRGKITFRVSKESVSERMVRIDA